MDGSETSARLKSAVLAFREGRLDDAESLFRDLMKSPAAFAEAAFGLGSIAFRRKDADAAIGWYGLVPADSPKRADARYQMAALERERGQRETALARAREALASDPTHVRARALIEALEPLLQKVAPTEPLVAAPPTNKTAVQPGRQSPPETTMILPRNEQELEDYVKRATARSQADWWIQNWSGLPIGARVARIVFAVVVLAIVLFIGGFAMSGLRMVEGIRSGGIFAGLLGGDPRAMTGSARPDSSASSNLPVVAKLRVVGVASGDTLAVHSLPGLSHPVLFQVGAGQSGIMDTGKAEMIDGITWRLVVFDGQAGWVDAHFVEAMP